MITYLYNFIGLNTFVNIIFAYTFQMLYRN